MKYPHIEHKIYPCQKCGHGNAFTAHSTEPIPQVIIDAVKAYVVAVNDTLPGEQARIDAQYV